MRRVNDTGIAVIKLMEGLRLKAYLCESGRPTIGWGSTEGIRLGMTITQDTAERLLQHDVQKRATAVEKLVKVPLSDDQFAALVSLVFNIGVTNFSTSTLLRLLNAGDYAGAANQFGVWRMVTDPVTKVKRISNILVKRRELERKLFIGQVSNLHG